MKDCLSFFGRGGNLHTSPPYYNVHRCMLISNKLNILHVTVTKAINSTKPNG